MTKGKVASIETMGLVDGPGIRTVIFLQGCPLRCVYCHNPDMQEAGLSVRKYSSEEIVDFLKRYKPYYSNGGGVTFSGGEPLNQKEFVLECAKLCKKENIHICLDTSGIGKDYEELLDNVDLVILDVKATDKDEFKKITGGNFDIFLKFLETCQKKKKKLWLRQVIVPGINDDEEHILRLKEFIKKLKNVERVELLPYHTMAKKKYEALNKPYPLGDTPEMDKKRCKQLEKLLTE